MKTNIPNPNEDLQTIREIMERSSKFLSLSGLSGIFAGLCALAGVAVAWFYIMDSAFVQLNECLQQSDSPAASGLRYAVSADALVVLGFAFFGAVYFSRRKAKREGLQFWTNSTRQLFVHLLIPLISGALFILILVLQNIFVLIPSVMLIFYGLALVNAGKFTLGEIHYLGLTQILLGILAGIFVNYGLLFWAIGFGLMHIIYGAVMYYRHER